MTMRNTTLPPLGVGRDGDVTQGRVLRSEWIKLRTLRSTYFSLVVTVIFMIGLGCLVSWGEETHLAEQSASERASFDATITSLRGMHLAQLAVGVLGVLVVTGEYATGMIHATLAAVPRRLPVLWAKAGVFAFVAFVVTLCASLISFALGQRILATQHIDTTLSAPGAVRAVVGTALYLAGVGVLGAALGTILRSTAGAIAALFGLLLVLPIVGEILPSSWRPHVTPYLPSNAGQSIMNTVRNPESMAPWTGFALFCGYLAFAMTLAALTLQRRDA